MRRSSLSTLVLTLYVALVTQGASAEVVHIDGLTTSQLAPAAIELLETRPSGGLSPIAGPRAPFTRHPVVLVHGIMAADQAPDGDAKGAYFNGVGARLRSLGVLVSAPRLGRTNGVVAEARILRDHINLYHPDGKVNLIGHSFGGLVSRYLITHLAMADRIASLTTVGTPHRGTPVANAIENDMAYRAAVRPALSTLGIPTDAFRDLTTASCSRFNATTPDQPGVRYFSYGGARPCADMRAPLIPFGCAIYAGERGGTVVRQASDALSQIIRAQPWGMALPNVDFLPPRNMPAIPAAARDPGMSDGVVPLWSTPWGESFTKVSLDHLGQIGWRIRDGIAPNFYEAIVRRLADDGF
jgi:pimeloyl-ACP methyl ester carboxylesterase